MGNYLLKGAEGSISIRDIETFDDIYNKSINTLLWVHIKSGPFSGAAQLDIGIEPLKEFAVNVKNMYETLTGEAFLKEVYGESYIRMKCTLCGHIEVKGILVDIDSGQRLKFEFMIDQTMLKDFAYALYNEYSVRLAIS